ncbi:hypothetical protein [Pseudorhodoferax sp.]|jgi:hypothetical protein|uniref:hypothetical protein n=1 Tax=Pseudorhodoferax sp. TaxID=1993553 RepID=UPI002DD67B2C|nr:hypothetical protein [Pseudorhodoferax sp.]
MKRCWWILLAPLGAQAGDADWLRCAELRESAPRLACYDAQAARLRQAPAAAASAASAAAAERVAAFGAPQRVPAQEIDAVQSRILGLFEGWDPGQVLLLENGQRWRIADGSSATLRLRDPKVTVRRAALGTFRIEFEGSNQTARVKRMP